jgi:hypothetical protein
MLTSDDLKALLIHAAYTGAVAVCEPLIANPDGTTVQIDPLIKDIGLQQKDLLVYEVAKIHYAAILRAFADKTGIWPDPPTAPSGTGPSLPNTPRALVDLVQSSLKGLPPTGVTEAAGLLLPYLSGLGQPPAPPRPPGSDVPPPAKP